MIQKIRTSKVTKVVAVYLAMMLFLEMVQPLRMYALTGGPSQPEFESFTPIGTSDMVDLASGDFNYNIPIMDVGGYPLNLAYNSGATMDQEASWVGLGWDLNVGQINRQMRGLPDDFDGDEMTYENNMKENVTIGSNVNLFLAGFGIGEAQVKSSVGLGVKYNNYDGFGFSVNGGLSYQISENLSVGMDMESSASEGVSVAPSASFNTKFSKNSGYNIGSSVGVGYNSRKGLESMSMSFKAGKSFINSKGVSKSFGGNYSGTMSFIDASFTPTKRVGMQSSNYMFSMNLQGEIWGIEPGVKFTGYRTSQGVKESEKNKKEKAYGYENTYNAGEKDILDFNREKDRTLNKNTTSLSVTNHTYDLYTVQGQGISGMYRPYKSQVGYVYDNKVQDDSNGGSLGFEIGGGGGVHWGFDVSVTNGNSSTGLWENSNTALERFKEKKEGNKPDYEKVFFKNIGGTHVDKELNLFNDNLGSYDAVKLELEGSSFARGTKKNYYRNGTEIAGTGIIKRESRVNRNQSIQKLTRAEAQKYGFKTQFSPYSLSVKNDHHTSEIRITKEGGERYIYGRAAYNSIKREVTFDVGSVPAVDCRNGLVYYNPGKDNSANNDKEGDQYFNRVTTPAYAHSYLLTSVLSSDYQDLKSDGPTDDDLGTYTKFEYDNVTKDKPFKWRMPFKQNIASYDDGLRSSKKDNKGNYQYGEKELLYIKKIETKTHVAVFSISARKDGYGVKGENGGLGTDSKMYKLDKVSLYSKPEYLANPEQAVPIKEAHFEYDYSLCQGIDNHEDAGKSGAVYQGQKGKLTLKKVYFTYKKSNMGKFTPYVFNYGYNPSYDMKAYDLWGNYKPTDDAIGCGTNDALSNAEYPYVDQSNRSKADAYAGAWLLASINLPSGAKMEMDFESDDYAHVQNRDVMQMFKVVGAGNKALSSEDNIYNTELYGRETAQFLYVKLDDTNTDNFYERYIKPIENEPIYFRFLLNMATQNWTLGGNDHKDKFDYVSGYLRINKDEGYSFYQDSSGNQYASIPIQMTKQGDGAGNPDVNPISKAGWYFGRQNLNRVVYSMTGEEDVNNIEGVVTELIGWIPTIFDIFKSPNGKLKEKGIASKFISGKSWIRLMQPNREKVGGGSRVKEIKMHDQWDVMTAHNDNELYKQFYGQKYSYKTAEGGTSGVATYEPLGGKENPFVEPFYDHSNRDLLLGTESENYVEKPFGESFFPAPKVTYSRVAVKNLPREKYQNGNLTKEVKRHATGEVVTEFYTSKDHPTLVDYTVLSAHYDKSGLLSSLLKINVKDHLTLSQGYAIHTNDMDGKMKSQRVYAEGQSNFISGVDYKYNEIASNPKNQGRLNNVVTTVNSNGEIKSKLVGVDYDVVNDFRENISITETPGVHFNTAGLPLFLMFLIVPVPVPSYSKHENQLRSAVTTKVIHTSGILSEKIAYDAGSEVATKNLAWDAETGDILLTETVNEYNDKYYSFNFPAYWSYKGMNQAATNLGLEWNISNITGTSKYEFDSYNAADYLVDGDEVWVTGTNVEKKKKATKAWVVKAAANQFILIDKDGLRIDKKLIETGQLKVIRSGYRNLQSATMATVTSMKNPLYNYDNNNVITTIKNNLDNSPYLSSSIGYRIVNASAIEYSNIWPAQCECELPRMTFDSNNTLVFEYEKDVNNDEPEDILKRSYNPYLYNVLGNWRANKSYAYLTGRNYSNVNENPSLRKIGFFNDFSPFYVYNTTTKKWVITGMSEFQKWTFASQVTKYNPYGQEIENKDALDRYSSALFGYNNRFPTAVASNSKYSELASDGFEDYDFSSCIASSHFNFQEPIKNSEGVTISPLQSHSGRRSMRIEPAKKISVKKQVISCEEINSNSTQRERKAQEAVVTKSTKK
ncbi:MULTISPECIES: hypothetical protein [unclassified Flavobacterium]|mgnify:CR=1 FL=1|uniref:hypothetical protein n=1 Tax=unclassified Flavobacterium TaxID=196869 RepID=UPI000969FA40|nr:MULTISPECIES: hypothetical protein [unclassified Flavobacterium]MBN9286252.1 hypothetical protein [Flavobacterium sp.]OJV73221.1 MAG: hypothetical protein BGO42_00015 [Flavobacterium sp. 40-81]